jgi:rubredoxin
MQEPVTMSTEALPHSAAESEFKVWQCMLCDFMYDESQGLPEEGIPAGTRWADVPDDWVCPQCSARKIDFDMVEV